MHSTVAEERWVLQHPPAEHYGPYTEVGARQLFATIAFGAGVGGPAEAYERRADLLLMGLGRYQLAGADGPRLLAKWLSLARSYSLRRARRGAEGTREGCLLYLLKYTEVSMRHSK